MGTQTVLIIDNDGFSDFDRVAGEDLSRQVSHDMNGRDGFYEDGPAAGTASASHATGVGVMAAHTKHEPHVIISEGGQLHDMHTQFIRARLKGAYPHTLKAEIARVEQLEEHARAAREVLDAKLAAQVRL